MAYSDEQFNTMQEEAIRRVREMQRRSRSMVNTPPDNSESQKAPEKSPPPPIPHSSPSLHKNNAGGLLGSILGTGKNGELFNLGGIKIDEEKALIGLLIYILYKQGADVKLLLGLGYLLL